VARYRARLQDLGWFMKALKEPLARLANKEDECTGTFWEARYKSIAILDDEALLATCAYIDLNPVAAGLASTPEASEHTSLRQRVDHCRRKREIPKLQQAAAASSAAAARTEGDVEQGHWLCPLQDRRVTGAAREGMLPGFSLSGYLELVDWTARLCRTGKAKLSKEAADIMIRLGTTAGTWQTRMHSLLRRTRWLGNYSATRCERLRAIARRRGVHHVDNVLGWKTVTEARCRRDRDRPICLQSA
jgi:hypothetical protein